jgi:hypothetical protein
LNDANDRGPRSPRVRHCDWKFLSDLNHNAKEGTVAIVINKASQTITVTTHAPGNALYNTASGRRS